MYSPIWTIVDGYRSLGGTLYENSNASNYIMYGAPDSSPKVTHPSCAIQLKRDMANFFCNGSIIQQRYITKTSMHDSHFILYGGIYRQP